MDSVHRGVEVMIRRWFTMKMIPKILSSSLHENLNSSYHVEANTQRIENSSHGSAAPIDEISLPSRAGGNPPEPPTTKIGGGGDGTKSPPVLLS